MAPMSCATSPTGDARPQRPGTRQGHPRARRSSSPPWDQGTASSSRQTLSDQERTTEALSEQGDERPPHVAELGPAMEQDQGRAATLAQVVNVDAVRMGIERL